jgi:Protein of unknown function (DUF3626)
MSDLGSIARSIAQTGANQRLIITDDGIQQKSGSFWHPIDTGNENRAQVEQFRKILMQDPSLSMTVGASEKAFETVRQALESGKPLTARLMAQAYTAGDSVVKAEKEARQVAQDKLFGFSRSMVRDTAMLDSFVKELSGGNPATIANLPGPALDLIMARIMDEVRGQFRTFERDGSVPQPRFSVAEEIIRQAVGHALTDIRNIAGRPATDFIGIPSNAPQRLAPLLDTLKEIGDKRRDALLLTSSGGGARLEQQLMRDMGDRLSGMSNRDLLTAYRALLSPDLLELRLVLANRPDDPTAVRLLSDLNSWEGMVQMELAERSLMNTDVVTGPHREAPLTGMQIATLSDVERRSMKRELVQQSDEYLRGDVGAPRTENTRALQRLDGSGVTLSEVSRLIRSSELTVNLPSSLFDPGGPFVDESGKLVPERARMKNIFELPPNTKSPSYIERRQLIEHSEMPTLVKQDEGGVDPSNHPVSSALNVGRNVPGGGWKGGYGDMFLVLKDEVRDTRATFTPRDAFYSYTATLTEMAVGQMKSDILGLMDKGSPPLSESGARALREDPTIIRRLFDRLDGAVGQSFGLGQPENLDDFVADTLIEGLQLSPRDSEVLLNLAVKTFANRSDDGNRVTSFERLTQVLGDVDDVVHEAITTGVQDPDRINLALSDYIEAQVFGGVDMTRDVKEIHVNTDLTSPEAMQAIKEFCAEYGITVHTFAQQDKDITRLHTDETIQSNFSTLKGEIGKSLVGSLDGFKEHRLPGLLDNYRSHEETFDPTGIHGRRHISRALIFANVMANVLREQGAEINPDVLYTTVALHDSGREGNGPDRWEGDSARIAREHYTQLGITDPDTLRRIETCIDSGGPKGQRSLEGMILKSADSMDIMRVYGRDEYRTDLLWFMNQDSRIGEDQYVIADHELRDKLLDEISDLIQLTEPKTESEVELETVREELGRVNAQVAELQLKIANGDGSQETPEQLRGLQDRSEELMLRSGELGRNAAEEHRTLNQSQSSTEVFQRIEDTLLLHPERFPTLVHYYDPKTG